ncbi:MAG TPA: 30S ribosomal protein S2 [Candidatus Limnocylindrales bacterium]|nr:30S ribosomal protein S2 [Candidatus Limnocylindrales bacterium]
MPVSMRQLLEAGVHFGHQTRRWNPKMRPYIFAERNGIHIIDLAQTVQRLDVALDFIRQTTARGETVLFVGTKKQAQEPITEEATRAGQPYVNSRWLGGMLTNFITIRKRLALLDQLEARQANGDFERLTKKEASGLSDEMARLQRTVGGMRKMRRLPGAVFVIDPHREHIAVVEARKLEIPVVGTGDTNVDPDLLDYIIPANDDAIRAIRLLSSLVADACLAGVAERAARDEEEPIVDEAVVAQAFEADESANDEMLATLAAGQSLSFEPGPDEEDELLPVHARAVVEDQPSAPEAPAADAPAAEAPKAKPSATEPPNGDAPAAEAPKAKASATEATEAPATEASAAGQAPAAESRPAAGE